MSDHIESPEEIIKNQKRTTAAFNIPKKVVRHFKQSEKRAMSSTKSKVKSTHKPRRLQIALHLIFDKNLKKLRDSRQNANRAEIPDNINLRIGKM